MSSPSGRNPTSAERIERLQRRRTRIIFVEALLFLVWQVNYYAADPAQLAHPAGQVKIGAYVVWAIALLAVLATGGGFRYGRAVRAILNDEVTRDHRRTAYQWGFWAAAAAALACYLLNMFEPLSARGAIHTVLTALVAVALLRFAILERRAQADG